MDNKSIMDDKAKKMDKLEKNKWPIEKKLHQSIEGRYVMDKFKIKVLIKVICFFTIMVSLFLIIQDIFVPKYYYPETIWEESTRIVSGFYEEKENSLDVLFLGTSHMNNAVSPMELYEKYKFTSYNLAMPSQPMEVTYYLLKNALEFQKPKVVVCDASYLFMGSTNAQTRWRLVLDEIPLGYNKLEIGMEFVEKYSEESLIGVIFPLFNYHDRWKSLVERDFTDFLRNRNYYAKGYSVMIDRAGFGITQEEITEQEQEMMNQDAKILKKYEEGISSLTITQNAIWNPTPSEEAVKYLLKMKELCDTNNIELLVTKIPVNTTPASGNAWTQQKYDEMKKLAEMYHIHYWDMLYDTDVGIDWLSDTRDGGGHLNVLGMMKTSSVLGNYLVGNYELGAEEKEEWEKDLEVWQAVRKVALLSLDNKFVSYIGQLKDEFSDKVIFMAVSNDFSSNWTEEDNELFQTSFGLQFNIADIYRGSYVAIIEQGKVTYEASSNRKINYTGKTLIGGRSYAITSSGYYTGSTAQIKIGGVNYAVGGEGLNIVVYDPELDMVLDSVVSEDSSAEHIIDRKIGIGGNQEYIKKFENYMIESTKR